MADNFSPTAHWRDSSRDARFFFIDANACFPLLFFLVHIRVWTFITALIAMIFFTTIARFGFTIPVFLRWLRLILAGPRKYALPWWRE